MTGYTVVHDAAQLVYTRNETVKTVPDAALAVRDGTVVASGPSDEVTREYPVDGAAVSVDASGKTVLPGFVDSHTHAVFAGDRSDEFAAKLQGKRYQEILDEGGGILRTVEAVRDTSREELADLLRGRLDAMLAHGTTTAEVKSGYGLDVDTERKLLRAVRDAAEDHPMTVVPTFLGAHAVPEGWETDAYVDHVVDEQLPAVVGEGLAEFCDVFCEAGVFSAAQSRRVLEAGAEAGLTPKVHAEEFEHTGGARLAADLGAASADHLLQATDADAAAMDDAGVTPVLLPGTAFTLDTDYADPDRFGEVAIATDFNPNCHSLSMEFALDLACHGMRMAPGDGIRAATAVAAEALNRTDGTGTLREGAPGDAIVADASSYEHIPYSFGVSTVDTVIAGGEVVVDG
ncbi:imidazolonepropionase [Haloarcula sediminis]|uniref:imidazolonepropionase n=1 Tax=Haloarcula sediminis TaxID=3111777 RepID=UPI002D79A93D|nr:imidazolonepropionase [Haloarcula sp. CK38]